MKPKRYAPPHPVRLYLDDDARLNEMPGNKAATKIREIVRAYFAARDSA